MFHETWHFVNGLNVFFHNLFMCLIQKRITKNIVWNSSHSKIDFKVKHFRVKGFLNKINYKKSLISNSMEEDIENQLSCFVRHPVWNYVYTPFNIIKSQKKLRNTYCLPLCSKYSLFTFMNKYLLNCKRKLRK